MAVNYHRSENGSLNSRGRCKKDIIRDLLISNAQNSNIFTKDINIRILTYNYE